MASTPCRRRPCEAHADDVRHADHHRHAEEDALGLEAAHAPAEHADAVDHRRVTVRADQGIGHGPRYAVALRGGDDACQALQVERVHDAGAGRMNADAREGARRPFHEAVALGIAAELALHVASERVGRAEHVDGQGMIGRDVDRQDGIEPARVIPGLGEGGAHAGDVHEGRAAGRVVHHDAAGQERDLVLAAALRQPVQDRRLGTRGVVARVAQDVLQHDPQDVRKPFELPLGRRRKIDNAMASPGNRDVGVLPHRTSRVPSMNGSPGRLICII